MADPVAYERAGYTVTWRDQLARAFANFAFRCLATKEYRAFVTVTVNVGLEQLKKELVADG